MNRYRVYGMMCAACSAAVEKAVRAVPGVTGCTVSLLIGELVVEGSADEKAVTEAVKRAGYRAERMEEPEAVSGERNSEESGLRQRLVISVAALLILMYIGMASSYFAVIFFLISSPEKSGSVNTIIPFSLVFWNIIFSN